MYLSLPRSRRITRLKILATFIGKGDGVAVPFSILVFLREKL